MPRKARPNTAEVVIRFRVPKGVTAAQAKRLIWNHYTGCIDIDPDAYEGEVFGDQTIKPKAIRATIIRAPKPEA